MVMTVDLPAAFCGGVRADARTSSEATEVRRVSGRATRHDGSMVLELEVTVVRAFLPVPTHLAGKRLRCGAMSDPGAQERPEPSLADTPEGGPGREHRVHLGHMHVHDVDCGHRAIGHGSHLDYLHDEHRHAGHGRHYDEH
jgi:hypothetical protein